MQTVKTTLLVLLCLVLLGACGLKGALYLPEEESAVEQGAAADTDKAKEKEDKTEKDKASG